MYEDFYNLQSLPFENVPDPRFFYASEQHREALAAIEYTIRMQKGIVLITGAVGAGKTTVSQAVQRNEAKGAKIVEVSFGHTSGSQLLRQILRRLGHNVTREDDHGLLLDSLEQVLLSYHEQQRPVVLMVDEAQTLCDEVLEELRLLTTLNRANKRLLQLVLIGTSDLRRRLSQPQHDSLRQRLAMAKQLEPLSVEETAEYIRHRIKAASIDPQQPQVKFDADAVAAVYQYSQGVPRLINMTCDNCLLLGLVRETRTINAAMVHRVARDMVPSIDDASDQTQLPTPKLALAGGM